MRDEFNKPCDLILKGPGTWGSSLVVVWWMRIRPAMQGTLVQPLVREDPTRHGATEPTCHSYWCFWAQSPGSTTRDATITRSPAHSNEDPAQPKINQYNFFKKPRYVILQSQVTITYLLLVQYKLFSITLYFKNLNVAFYIVIRLHTSPRIFQLKRKSLSK